MFGVGNGGSPAHAAVATTITAASKTITLLKRVAIAGNYTHAVTIQLSSFYRHFRRNIENGRKSRIPDLAVRRTLSVGRNVAHAPSRSRLTFTSPFTCRFSTV